MSSRRSKVVPRMFLRLPLHVSVHQALAIFSLTVLLKLPSALVQVAAEFQDFSTVLNATAEYIHYGDGYLRGPNASIDLRGLNFEATSEAGMLDATMGRDDDGDGNRHYSFRQRQRFLLSSSPLSSALSQHRFSKNILEKNQVLRLRSTEDEAIDNSITRVDVASFLLPDYCANSRSGCDWTALGVGGMLEDGTYAWCCVDDAIRLGMCEDSPSTYGRLILTRAFQGLNSSIEVPATGPMEKSFDNGYFEFDLSGRYVVIFANCNPSGRQVTMTGTAVWESNHGYLPGQLYGFMYFYFLLLTVYLLLFVWFVILMRQHRESRIPIEKWILLTIFMGLCEQIFRVSDYLTWNRMGEHSNFLMYSSMVWNVIKEGFSRCLIVMVSLGWGVIRDTLGKDLFKIAALGSIYIAFATLLELAIVLAEVGVQSLGKEAEAELFDFATIFNFVVAAVNVVFIMWILDALNATMTYLETMNQSRKLARYLRLRSILLYATLFAVVWAVFAIVDTYNEDGIVREEQEWIVNAATDVNYLAVLLGVAILWRPNPNAKEYAFVMELSSSGMDRDGETELELTSVVPSAMDDDEDDNDYEVADFSPNNDHHHPNDNPQQQQRFKVNESDLS